MLFALTQLFILSICVPGLYGNDVIETSAEIINSTHFAATTRPLPHRNQTKIARHDQLLSLLATRRRQIIENRFKSHIKRIVDLTKHGNPGNLSDKFEKFPNGTTTVNIHLKLSDILHNSVKNSSDDQSIEATATETNKLNSSLRSTQENKKNVVANRDASQIPENKSHSKLIVPIRRNMLFRRKMSYLNRKLPLDFDQISEDTLGLSEIGKTTDDLIMDAEDSLQVEESSHDKFVYYDVKNNATKKSMNNFDDISEEIKTISMINKTNLHDIKLASAEVLGDKSNVLNTTSNDKHSIKNKTDLSLNNQHNLNNTNLKIETTTEQNYKIDKSIIKINNKDNKTEIKNGRNNTHFMSQSLYNYFRPPEDVPDEDMQPFLHFGDKLPRKNTTRHQIPKIIQITPKEKIIMEDNATQKRTDEDEVDEHMDVSITKPIYENKIIKVVVPNQKVNVVQHYTNNRTISLIKPLNTRNFTKLEKKNHIVRMPQLHKVSRHRGYRNRTIFFHQKRNGVRHTINLRPNSTIADLKPVITNENVPNRKRNNVTYSQKMVVNNSTVEMQTENSIPIQNRSKNEETTVKNLATSLNLQHKLNNTSTTQRTKTSEAAIETIKTTTKKIPKITESTTSTTTKRLITTVVIPTTRILATDVVTSISVKSANLGSTNKTNITNADILTTNSSEINQIKLLLNNTNITYPEATVIAQLNNFTSLSFKNKLPKLNSTLKSISIVSKINEDLLPINIFPNLSKTTPEIKTPVFYLNKTNFIIHVPDTEITTNADVTERVTDNMEITETENFETTTKPNQLLENVQINTRINHEDVTEKEVTHTMTSTSRSKTHGTTIKTLVYSSVRPNVTNKKSQMHYLSEQPKNTSISYEQTKKILNFYNSSVIESPDFSSELPLATLFNVKDLKKPEVPRNTTVESKIIPGTETVISRKNDNDSSFDNIHAAYILASLGLIPMAVIIIYVIRNLMMRKNKCFDDFEAELQDDKATIITPVTRLPALVVDSSTKWEFPRSKLRMQTLLGQGNFGQVWKAEADDLKGHIGLTRLVAVKTIKDDAGSKDREDLLRELALMQKMGSHPNVVTLLGCCTEKEPYLLIMEYVMYGKLLTYLRDHRTRRDYFNFSDDAATLTARDLTVFAYCVARGMEYLGTKGIIHRDLAARNVLVDHNKLCKIADFGMSRDCHGDEEITEPRQPRNALPVRWMAIESLLYSVFTFKTDVWSFGVLLWEIVTLGSSPYANMSGREVMRLISDGYRLERPNHCKPELYNVMARTWRDDPDQRPSFTELRTELADMLENTTAEGSYVDLESFRADSTVYEIDNLTPRGNYFTVKSRFSEFECDI